MQIKINKRSAYAPIRYEATRPFALPLAKAFIAASKRGDKARLEFLSDSLINALRMGVAKIGRENGPGPVQSEALNIQIFGNYLSGGKVIFDIDKTLAQILVLSESEEIPCGEIVYPAEYFYLHFGSESGLTLDGFNIEGAYVSRMHDRLIVDLIPQGFGQQHFFALPRGDTCIGTHIMLNDPEKSVKQALAESIAKVIADNAKAKAQVAELERKLTERYGQIVKAPSPNEDIADKEPLLFKALSLILNTMFYLAAEPEDVVEGWGRDTPIEALAALKTADKPGTLKTLENTLVKSGYSKVRFVGRSFSDSLVGRQIHAASESGRSLATHFRRGHFRRQPHGPNRALRKTIFVAPVVVNSSLSDEPQQGRIYEIKSSGK